MSQGASKRVGRRLILAAVIVIGVGLVVRELLMAPRVRGAKPLPAFEAAPERADEEALVFLALGDTGSGNATVRNVGRAMAEVLEQRGAEFVLLLGDNFYPEGVSGPDDPLWESHFMEPFPAERLPIPFYAVLGNHDHRGDRPDAQVAWRGDPRWRMPRRFYDFQRELAGVPWVHVFLLDTTPFHHGDKAEIAEQVGWLEAVLPASEARWKLVVTHHPVRSGENDPVEVQTKTGRILEEVLVHVVLGSPAIELAQVVGEHAPVLAALRPQLEVHDPDGVSAAVGGVHQQHVARIQTEMRDARPGQQIGDGEGPLERRGAVAPPGQDDLQWRGVLDRFHHEQLSPDESGAALLPEGEHGRHRGQHSTPRQGTRALDHGALLPQPPRRRAQAGRQPPAQTPQLALLDEGRATPDADQCVRAAGPRLQSAHLAVTPQCPQQGLAPVCRGPGSQIPAPVSRSTVSDRELRAQAAEAIRHRTAESTPAACGAPPPGRLVSFVRG